MDASLPPLFDLLGLTPATTGAVTPQASDSPAFFTVTLGSSSPTPTPAAPTASSQVKAGKTSAQAEAVPSTLTEAFGLWLTLPRAGGKGVNADRSQTDIANHHRALELLGLGSREVDDLSEVPLADLALEVELVREKLYEGAKLQVQRNKRTEPSAKTLSNLASNLMRLRSDLKDILSLPKFAPKAGSQLRQALRRRKRREQLPHDAWPESLRKDWQDFAAYRTDAFYAGPGKEYRTQAVREVTLHANKVQIGQYVRYCLLEEKLADFSFEELVDLERVHRFRAWYFNTGIEGGYDGFRQCCIALAAFAKFLCATGRAFSEFTPDTNTKKAPWSIFYKLGRTTKAEGAGAGKLINTTRVPHMTPLEVLALAERAWTTKPRLNGNNGTNEFTIFNRKRAAIFFALAPFMPIRRRNWADMRWGKNLYRQRDGSWVVSFKGEELKVGQRKGAVNVYEHELPAMACMWIERWRDYLREQLGPDFETKVPNFFPARQLKRDANGSPTWAPCHYDVLPRSIGDTCLELRGHDFPMHQIRHIMATSLVNSATTLKDAEIAADLLGDKIETIIAYYHRPNRDALRKAYFEKLQAEAGFKA